MSSLTLNVFILLVLTIASSNSQEELSQEQCDERMTIMDRNFAKAILVFNPQLKPFLSTDDMKNNYCQPLFKDWLKEINKFKPCLKNFRRTVFALAVSNMKKTAKNQCEKPQALSEAVFHSKCFSTDNVKSLYEIANKFTVVIEHAYNSSDTTIMINKLCCGYNEALDRIREEINTLCTSTSSGAGNFIQNLVRSVMSEAVDMICPQYPDVDSCKEKSLLIMRDAVLALNRNRPLYPFTPFTSFVKVISKLDEDLNVPSK